MLTNNKSHDKNKIQVFKYEIDMVQVFKPATREGLVHGLSWIGLPAPTTPWLRATVLTLMLCKQPTVENGMAGCENFGMDTVTRFGKYVAMVQMFSI
ncbi:hypothetical protein TIFTF001_023039 [Ficus carica]|uniref:Uncharacterized protein n=1 Tax=Ficus carica TaxID=3494 RepID=A0AA88AFH8_FICCA|nr:hypothetical protein TIFTF001_023039 [Ficus carica]